MNRKQNNHPSLKTLVSTSVREEDDIYIEEVGRAPRAFINRSLFKKSNDEKKLLKELKKKYKSQLS